MGSIEEYSNFNQTKSIIQNNNSSSKMTLNISNAELQSKYIISMLSKNMLNSYYKNDTRGMVDNYFMTLKFIKNCFMQQKSISIDEIETI